VGRTHNTQLYPIVAEQQSVLLTLEELSPSKGDDSGKTRLTGPRDTVHASDKERKRKIIVLDEFGLRSLHLPRWHL
jgi:hypothetical protein